MIVTIFTDGGAKGNPGPAAIGVVMYDEAQKDILRFRKDIGNATNNVAEYTAVLTALKIVKDKRESKVWEVDSIKLYSDSKLLVEQLSGNYKVKNEALKELCMQVHMLEREMGISVVYTHVGRDKNTVADALVNNAISSSI